MPRFTTSRRPARIFAIVVLVFGLGWLGLYGWYVWNQVNNGVDTDAVIIRREPKSKGNVSLVVQYTANDGQRYETFFTEYSNPELHGEGATIRIRYVPGQEFNPRQADEPRGNPVFFVAGGFILLSGVGLLIWSWRRPPDQASAA